MKKRKSKKIKKKRIYLFILFIIIISIVLFTNNPKERPVKDEWIVISEKIKFFKKDNLNRYKEYKKNNPDMSNTDVVKYVNIGLDNPFYTNTKEAKNRDTFYILVNKYNYLDKDYVPKDLVAIDYTKLSKHVANAFTEMKNAAKNENLNIIAVSGYRSYSYQDRLYNKYAKADGTEKADTYSARAGFSEHQTGLAVDVSNEKLPYTQFEKTKEFEWMKENAYKYGFILRYQKEKENITGYMYESWHYRYVGIEISTYIQKNNITYDEYYVMFIDK